MATIALDKETSLKLKQAKLPVDIVDPDGRIVGVFTPCDLDPRQPRISEEEIARRAAKGGGRTLQEIFADLERRQ